MRSTNNKNTGGHRDEGLYYVIRCSVRVVTRGRGLGRWPPAQGLAREQREAEYGGGEKAQWSRMASARLVLGCSCGQPLELFLLVFRVRRARWAGGGDLQAASG